MYYYVDVSESEALIGVGEQKLSMAEHMTGRRDLICVLSR